MSTIQQAAQRLEELRRAGVNIPWESETQEDRAAAAAAMAEGEVATPPVAATPLLPPKAPRRVVPTGRQSEMISLDLPRLASAGFLVPGHANLQRGEELPPEVPVAKDEAPRPEKVTADAVNYVIMGSDSRTAVVFALSSFSTSMSARYTFSRCDERSMSMKSSTMRPPMLRNRSW